MAGRARVRPPDDVELEALLRDTLGSDYDVTVVVVTGRQPVDRLVRRTRVRADDHEPIVVGYLRIERSSRAVAVGGRPVDLTRREFDLLARLASHPGMVFSKDELLREV